MKEYYSLSRDLLHHCMVFCKIWKERAVNALKDYQVRVKEGTYYEK